jgi:hypothetical protein
MEKPQFIVTPGFGETFRENLHFSAAGHWVQHEAADQVSAALINFLKGPARKNS